MSDVVGWATHAQAVARLRASYDAIPPGAPVRLAKRTLEPVPRPVPGGRPRSRRLRPGRSRLARRAPRRHGHRRRPGHVHLRGPRRRHAAARVRPVRRAAAAQHHPRRRGHRPRHRVDVVPQRPAARVGARDGRADRRRRRGDDQTRRGPVRRVPELLRLAGLRDPDPDTSREGAGVRRPAAPALRRPGRPGQDGRGDRRAGRARRHPGRRARRRGVRAGGGLPDAGHLGSRQAQPTSTARPARRRTTRGWTCTSGPSSSARPTP